MLLKSYCGANGNYKESTLRTSQPLLSNNLEKLRSLPLVILAHEKTRIPL